MLKILCERYKKGRLFDDLEPSGINDFTGFITKLEYVYATIKIIKRQIDTLAGWS